MNNVCKHCDMRKAVYRISWYRYSKYKIYYCEKHKRTVSNDDGCEHFTPRTYPIDLSEQRFDNAVNDIKFLIEYLKEVK